MKNCKTALVLSAALLCLTLAGCKELPMDYGVLTAEPQTVIVGETVTLNVPLPMEKAEGIASTVTEGHNSRLSAVYIAPELQITGIVPGEAEVQIEFSAGWLYKKSHLTIPVKVELPQLTATFDKEPLTIALGESFDTSIQSPESDISIVIDDKAALPNLAITQDGTNITLQAKAVGKSQFSIVVSKEGFRDAVLLCEVEVIPIPVPLDFTTDQDISSAITGTKKLEIGKTLTIGLVTEGELSVASDNPAVTAVIADGNLKITGVTEGTATVTIHAKKEHYLDNTLSLNCTVTAAQPAAPAASAAPSGPYGQLVQEIVNSTNAERAKEGLAPLKYSASLSKAADVRAKEIATPGYQAHTRPDGRRGLTVIDDAGLGEYNATGENLSGADFTENGAEIVQRWMNSPPHRAAILMPEFKTIGVGVYYDGDMYRYCQLFTGTKF